LLDGADLLCLSGGVSADIPLAQAARRRGLPLSNDSQIFLQVCPAGVTVVGITGSAGKTTTTTLVGRMLAATPPNSAEGTAVQASGEGQGRGAGRVFVGGNIGHPLIADVDHLQPGDLAVMELSSFQLEIMTLAPQVGAVLNITPNHLDRHGTLEAYAAAKSRLLRFQPPGGVSILGRDDPGARALEPLAPGAIAWFSAAGPVDAGAWLRGDELVWRWQGQEAVAATRADLELRGAHNLLNALAACAISGAAGAGPEAMRAGLRGFRGVAHRLELVRDKDGVKWYNDSIATAPERVLAAVRAFDEPLVLLLGGRDKKLPWDELAGLVARRARAAVIFGEAAPLIAAALAAGGLPAERLARAGSLAEAVALAARRAQPGDVVLLSPGGTSYDAFTDFAERGEKYRELVNEL
jgi:UDP-N-acetylmuramoylalanine--D-glutamate ligase